MNLRFITLGVLAAVIAVTGCGGSSTVADNAIAEAATKTTDAGSYRASFEIAFEGFTDKPLAMTGEGLFDAKDRRGRVTLDLSDFAQGAGAEGLDRAELVFDELVFYMKFAPLTKAFPASKPWIRIDLKALGKQQGLNLGQLSQLNQSDPSQVLEYLRGASDDVEDVGEEHVRGAKTTHYRMTVDLDKVAKQAPDQKANVERVIELSGIKEIPTDVWIDGERRVRRMQFEYRDIRFTPGQKGDMTVTMELYDFGVDADVEPPPADEVTDLGELTATAAS